MQQNKGYIVSYDAGALSTLRVFCILQGTVLGNKTLWLNELLVVGCVLATMVPTLWLGLHDEEYLNWLKLNEEKTRAFLQTLQMLASFLLSFYVSLSVGRWWTLRTNGVGGIVNASVDLSLALSRFVTKDHDVLEAVNRYARASLVLLFFQRQERTDFAELVQTQILTEEELTVLLKVDPHQNMPHCCWTWITEIVAKLRREQKIKSDQELVSLQEICARGRASVTTIQTGLSCQIPMNYVHLLCLLVKVHNTFLSFFMGMLVSYNFATHNWIQCSQICFRILMLTFAFNGLLIIADELQDPFSGEANDFPMPAIDAGLMNLGHVYSAGPLPKWLTTKE